MTVRELIEELEGYDDNKEVLMCPSFSDYVESIGEVNGLREIRAFYGSDFDAVILGSNGQVGMI